MAGVLELADTWKVLPPIWDLLCPGFLSSQVPIGPLRWSVVVVSAPLRPPRVGVRLDMPLDTVDAGLVSAVVAVGPGDGGCQVAPASGIKSAGWLVGGFVGHRFSSLGTCLRLGSICCFVLVSVEPRFLVRISSFVTLLHGLTAQGAVQAKYLGQYLSMMRTLHVELLATAHT